MSDYISHDHEHDGVDRRGFLKCMAWAGTGVLWTISGGVLVSKTLAQIAKVGGSLPTATDLSFLQISDSHIGFSKDANKDVTDTFKVALDRINAMPTPPSFLIHTGDITQLSKPEEFDTFDEVLKSCRTKDVFFVPGEHDVLNDGGKFYRERYLKSVEAKGSGWFSFNKNGVHFIGLVNVLDLQAGGLGQLGDDQLEWLEADVKGLGADTPIVVFAHIPLWAVYPEWGWGTSDSERALGYLKRFGSVTVLNGHLHQVLQEVDGATGKQNRIEIKDFAFNPKTITVKAGEKITWINRDEEPHTVVSVEKQFKKSSALDTDQEFTITANPPGTYTYYCSVHPKMTGTIVVEK